MCAISHELGAHIFMISFFIHSHFLEFLTTIARIQRNGIFQLPFFPVAEEAIVPWKAAPKKRKTMYLRKRKRISFVNFCPLSVTSCSLKEIQMNKFYIYWFSLLFWSNMVCSLLTITAHVLFKANFAAVWRNISRVPPPLSHTLETTMLILLFIYKYLFPLKKWLHTSRAQPIIKD